MASKGLLILGVISVLFIVIGIILVVLFILANNSSDDTPPALLPDPCLTTPGYDHSKYSPALGVPEGWYGAQPISGVCTLPSNITDPTQFTNFKSAAENVANQAGTGWAVVNNTPGTYTFTGQFFESDKTTYMNFNYITDDGAGKPNTIVDWFYTKQGDEYLALYSNMSFFFSINIITSGVTTTYNISTACDGSCLVTPSGGFADPLIITIALNTDNTPFITLSGCPPDTSTDAPSTSDISGLSL